MIDEKAIKIALEKHVLPYLLKDNERFMNMLENCVKASNKAHTRMASIERRLDSPNCPTCRRKR